MKKNKMLLFFCCLSLIVSIGVNILREDNRGLIADTILNNLEAIANSESGGTYLTCYCALMSDNNCATNNNGSSKCAGGENIKCWEYDRNCN